MIGKWVSVVLVVGLALCGCSGSSGESRDSQCSSPPGIRPTPTPHPNTDDPRRFLSPSTHPCLQSIALGETSFSEAREALRECPSVDPERDSSILPSGDDDPLYAQKYLWLEVSVPPSVREEIWSAHDHSRFNQIVAFRGVVEVINLNVFVPYTLADVIEEHGVPDWIDAIHQSAAGREFVVHLYYPQKGFAAQIVASVDDLGQLSPQLQIDRLIYARPAKTNAFLDRVGRADGWHDDWLCDCAMDLLRPWPGYGPVEVIEASSLVPPVPNGYSRPADVPCHLIEFEAYLSEYITQFRLDAFTLTVSPDGTSVTAQFSPGYAVGWNEPASVFLLEAIYRAFPDAEVYRLEFFAKVWGDDLLRHLSLNDVYAWDRREAVIWQLTESGAGFQFEEATEQGMERVWGGNAFIEALPFKRVSAGN